MKFIFMEVVKGVTVLIGVYIISYIIEKCSRFKLLIWSFKVPKNLDMAQGSANVDASIFFIICLGTLLFDLNRVSVTPEGYSFWKWLLVMVPLTIVFRMIYYKLTPKDPDRDDFDFSE